MCQNMKKMTSIVILEFGLVAIWILVVINKSLVIICICFSNLIFYLMSDILFVYCYLYFVETYTLSQNL
jgi:hypothetical protein